MFLNLRPYLTWLGIMLTSNPDTLQSNLNQLTQTTPSVVGSTSARPTTSPPLISTEPPTTISTSTEGLPTTTADLGDFFLCSGLPAGRYPHSRNCSKYFVCTGQTLVGSPFVCPGDLHFAPEFSLCTLPEDAGCLSTESPPEEPVTTNETSTAATSTAMPTSPPPSNMTWLANIQASDYPTPVNDEKIAIYYDHDVQNPPWLTSFTRTMWGKVVDMYIGIRAFTTRDKLHIVFRSQPMSSDLPSFSTFLDATRDHINAIEISSEDWSIENSENANLVASNMAQIIAQSGLGTRYSFPEPFWLEILVYDLYDSIGRLDDRDQWEVKVQQDLESNIAIIPIFSQWYLPIYNRYGRGSVLNRFIVTRNLIFPKDPENSSLFARAMNRGEFVHFWSYAVGANLTNLATQVFGWNGLLSSQYEVATQEFAFPY